MLEPSLVTYECAGHIATITLNRPERLNAMNDRLAGDLRASFRRFDDEDDAWVAILTGAGRSFCAGADVRERLGKSSAEMRQDGGPVARGASTSGLLREQAHFKPVIAAVQGHALGIGLELVLDAEVAVVDENTVLQILETRRGLSGSKYWLKLNLRGAEAFATDVCVTGRRFSADEARSAGVIAHVAAFGTSLTQAQAVAQDILECPPLAVRQSVRMRRLWHTQMEGGLPAVRMTEPALYLSGDFRESTQALVENRAHQPWRGV